MTYFSGNDVYLEVYSKHFNDISVVLYDHPRHVSNAYGIILVFDVTNRESFQAIPNYINYVETSPYFHPILTKFFLVGNKRDQRKKRKVSYKEAFEFAQALGIQYFECAAKNIDNAGETEGILQAIAKDVVSQQQIYKYKLFQIKKAVAATIKDIRPDPLSQDKPCESELNSNGTGSVLATMVLSALTLWTLLVTCSK